ncbi:CHASE3 domain-containing protein [Amycolatopsis sp. NPDC051114]|uniref:CHASE3 domain-containing protein n=1 Tax=Amycolatopsis sp. NPDC051114 TaxID=3155280 RepID=UPI0034206CE2
MSAEARGWTIRRWLSLFAVVEAVLLLAAVTGAAIAMNNLTEARNSLLDVIGPQRLAATQLSTALLNQETGVRGYQLGRQPDFLTPYTEGRQAEGDAVSQLRQLGALPGTQAGDDLEAVLRAATTWQAAAAPAVEPGASPLTQAHSSTKCRNPGTKTFLNRFPTVSVSPTEDPRQRVVPRNAPHSLRTECPQWIFRAHFRLTPGYCA